MVSHKSLLAWQETAWVSATVLDISRTCWRPYAQAVFSQLQRASLSAQVNIAEGYAYTNSPTFLRHLTVAYGSAIETGELLELLESRDLLPRETANALITHCRNSQKLILGLLKRYRKDLKR